MTAMGLLEPPGAKIRVTKRVMCSPNFDLVVVWGPTAV